MLSLETRKFIEQHLNDDVRQLALRGTKLPGVDLSLALDQIAGRQTAKRKLPSWAAIDGLVYPPHLAMEQCSSTQMAQYKSLLAKRVCQQGLLLDSHAAGYAPQELSFADLTGGFGVDFSFLARHFDRAVYVERQEHLCCLACHNFPLLGLTHAEVVCADGTDYLHRMQPVTMLFLDPARRDEHGGRTYALADCTPDVISLRDTLLDKCRWLLLKLSPMLDWTKAVSDLGREYVSEVHIVATDRECKELLLLLSKVNNRADSHAESKADSHAESIADNQTLTLTCVHDNERWTTTDVSPREPHAFLVPQSGMFLYEPNAAVMKSGCFAQLCEQFMVGQVGPGSHLFVSDEQLEAFPGRRFRISRVFSLNKKELRTALQGVERANITVRNFPLTVAELRKRLRLSDGGDCYLFATTQADGTHVLLMCGKV